MSSSSVLLTVLFPLLAFLSSGIKGYHNQEILQEIIGDAAAPPLSSLSWDVTDFNSCLAHLDNQCGLMEADKIEKLPGQPTWDASQDFDQYAGYVTVDHEAGRALFYYFTEAYEDLRESGESAPLLLWFNGGGKWEVLSSLGHGAMIGQGPLRVNNDGETLSLNDYAWNKVANIIFLESPAGVGFSYSNLTWDYDHIGNTKAVADSFTFLINWLERFPQYKTRDFYIGGDGYAGFFVPQLAYTILLYNKNCNKTFINLKGITIGNGWMDEEIYLKGVYDYAWLHNLISDEIHEGILTKCNFAFPMILSPSCWNYLNKAAEMVADINPYDIYGPPCKSSSKNNITVGGFDSCSHLYVESYLNLPSVQKALHANITGLPYRWTANSSIIKGWKDWYPTISPIIKELMGNGTRVWLYSGDTDSVVPITSTTYFIDSLQLPVQTLSYPWYAQGEVAGLAVGYENLTFVSVRGGGHFVPSYQPARALTLFSSFIEGNLPPSSPN